MLNSKPSKILTLLLIHQQPRILLAMKKKGFGKGKYNGFGGKVQKNGESIYQAAIRETKEQGCIEPTDAKLIGYIKMNYNCQPQTFKVFIFKANNYIGQISQTQQMKAQWFHINDIPYKNMWIDDQYWMPLLLEGKFFKGYLEFQGHQKLVKVEIKEIGGEELMGVCEKQSDVRVQ